MSRNKNGIHKQHGQLLTFDNSLKIKNVSMSFFMEQMVGKLYLAAVNWDHDTPVELLKRVKISDHSVTSKREMHQNNCFSSYSSQDLVIRNDLTLKNNVVLDIKMSFPSVAI